MSAPALSRRERRARMSSGSPATALMRWIDGAYPVFSTRSSWRPGGTIAPLMGETPIDLPSMRPGAPPGDEVTERSAVTAARETRMGRAAVAVVTGLLAVEADGRPGRRRGAGEERRHRREGEAAGRGGGAGGAVEAQLRGRVPVDGHPHLVPAAGHGHRDRRHPDLDLVHP